MGRSLYAEFLEDRIANLQEAVIHHGVEGVLRAFEAWLREKGHVKED